MPRRRSSTADPDTEVNWWSARRVAEAIRKREISSVEYFDILMRKISDHNDDLGLVVTFDDNARSLCAAADAADRTTQPVGPLHGVAMSVKDSFSTRGLRTTAGMPEFAEHIPREDATVVASLRNAGAIVYGKSNTPAGAADVQTYNDIFGTSRNPWSADHTTSGSSGGAAGAVAAGLTAIEIGSDVAGSIRLPAASCGVHGHKPSFGIVPSYGHLPANRMPGTTDMSVAGPLARSVDDLELLLDIMRGPDPWEAQAWHVTLPPARPIRRVAAWFDDGYCPVDSEVRHALERAAGLLSDDGVVVKDTTPRGVSLAEADDVFHRMLSFMSTADTFVPGGLGGRYAEQSHHDWLRATSRRVQLRERWRLFFLRYDAILLPVMPNRTPPHDRRPFDERRVVVNGEQRHYWDQTTWAGLTGVAYLPTTVVPIGLDSDGLPIGIAITGPYLGDRTTLAVARRLSGLLPAIGHPPVASRTP